MYSSTNDAAMAGVAIVALIFLAVIAAYAVIGIIGMWKMFKKAGKPGWAAIIPFYNVWVLGTIAFQNKGKTIGLLISTIAYSVLAGMSGTLTGSVTMGSTTYNYTSSAASSGDVVVSGLAGLAAIAYLVFSILCAISTAKAFGKGGGFAVGIIFLGPIFYMILGCSKDIFYIGPDGIPAGGYQQPYGQQPYGQMPQQQYQQPYQQPYQQQAYQQPQAQPYAQPQQAQPYQPAQQPYAQPYQPAQQAQPYQPEQQAQPQYPQYPQYPQQ